MLCLFIAMQIISWSHLSVTRHYKINYFILLLLLLLLLLLFFQPVIVVFFMFFFFFNKPRIEITYAKSHLPFRKKRKERKGGVLLSVNTGLKIAACQWPNFRGGSFLNLIIWCLNSYLVLFQHSVHLTSVEDDNTTMLILFVVGQLQ